MAKGAKGQVVQVIGTVVDIEFPPDELPTIYNALNVTMPDGSRLVVEVQQHLGNNWVRALAMDTTDGLPRGAEALDPGEPITVPVGEACLGRLLNVLGEPIDDRGPIESSEVFAVERVAPDVVSRQSVSVPLQTGIKAIDAMTAIGRGQRELIIGDRSIGKSALIIDTIINQRGGDVTCIYVAIGQKDAKVAQTVATLEQHGAMEHTIVVVASAAESPALQFLAPYAGCAMGEYFMEQGKDVLIAYDDLTKHSWAYREVSLLLQRPPGREAYPGDVFYLHSRLLERSARLNAENGGGSMTALPVIETQAGDISGYIPTNVISITDGQIFLEGDLFNAGQRPAVNPGTSVSRVGGAAQRNAMRKVAGTLRLDLSQFRELQAFAQFGTDDLDASTRRQLERGARLTELLKQPQYMPQTLAEQVTILYCGVNGYLDDVPVEKVGDFESGFHEHMHASAPEVLSAIDETGELTDETEAALKQAITDFKGSVAY